MDRVKRFKGRRILDGRASGPAIVSRERLSFRGFSNLEKGTFTGGMGKLEGVSFAGAVLIFPSSKGSTLWSITLDHACRFGNAPAAMIVSHLDPFVVLGCVLQEIPLMHVEDPGIFDQVETGSMVVVEVEGEEITITQSP